VATTGGGQPQRRGSSTRSRGAKRPTSDVRVERNIYQRVNRDGTLGRFRAIGAGGVRRTFDTLADAREFRDREAELTREQVETLKPDTKIDREFVEGVLLYLERNDHLAAATLNGYRKTARYSLYPWIDPDPGTGLRPHPWTTRTLTARQLEEWCSHRTEADPAAYTNRVKLALVLGRTLVATRMRADNPAAGLEARNHVRSAKTIRSRSRRRTATGERLWIPTFGELLALVDGMPELYRLWFLFIGLTGMRPSEAAGMRWDQGLIDTANGWIYTPALPMVEQNVGYWACGGVSVMDPEWETKLDQRIAAGQRTGKTMLSPERRILLLDQLVDEVLGPLEEFRPLDGVPWLFPGRRTAKALNTAFGSVPLSYNNAQVKLREQVAGTPLEGLQQYELRHYFASVVIAAGASFSEAADYLGNSEGEVRRTYAHLVRERADEIRRAAGSIIQAEETRT
jgi:integrase